MHGFGCASWDNNSKKYAGCYEHNKIHGFGIFTYANGCQIEGQWEKGKCHGIAIFRDEVGNENKGLWKNGVHKEWYDKPIPANLKKFENIQVPVQKPKQNSDIDSLDSQHIEDLSTSGASFLTKVAVIDQQV